MSTLEASLLALATLLFGLLVKDYLPGYFREKGKNLATKEDIEGITRKIEEVRTQYTHELERVRAQLQVSASQQSSFASSRREALMRFFETASELLSYRLRQNLGDFQIDDGKTLVEYQRRTNELLTHLNIDFHRLALFFSVESELSRAAGDLVSSTGPVRQAFKEHFGRVKSALVAEGRASGSEETEYRYAAENTNKASQAYSNALTPVHNEALRALALFIAKLNKHLRSEGAGGVPDLDVPESPEVRTPGR